VSLIKLRTLLLCDKLYIILAIITLFSSYLISNCYPYHSKYNIKDNNISGYIDNVKIDGNELKIILIGKEKIIIKYYFKNLDEKESCNLKLGDYIKVIGNINKPKSSSVFNLFDYKKYLYHNNIYYLFKATKIEFVKENYRLRYKIKQFIIDHINKIPKSSNYVKALVIGDDDGFREEVTNSYQLNGVSHLFAISGSHITFLSIIILWLLKRLKIEENKRYYIVIIFLLFYMFLTDYAGSVLRSVVFFILISLNKMYYFNIKTVNILLLSLFVLLIAKPGLIYDVGFQFSFLISLYLIIYQSIISKINNYIKQLFIISLISFLVSIPICINNFFQINLLSILINIFFVPYVSFILFPLSFLILLFPFLDCILFFCINILENISIFLSSIKIGEIILSKPPFIIIILYYIFITIGINGILHKKRIYIVPLILLIVIHSNINLFNNLPYVVFLDVGQGDSTLISLPHNGGNILIDTGGKLSFKNSWQTKNSEYKIGIDTIIPYLKSVGIKKLDYLILTHGDEDHMGEALNIVNNFKVNNVILNSGSLVTLEKKLINNFKKLHINYFYGKDKDIININDYKFYILSPKIDINENKNSLVIYTKINSTRFLFMGDADISTEERIINEYKNLKTDILKVGHHGSKTSTSECLLKTTKPRYAVIQVGLNNRFNHPSASVIERLKEYKVKIYQTSINGSVKFIIRSNDVSIVLP
jgi:competence protein ComEC